MEAVGACGGAAADGVRPLWAGRLPADHLGRLYRREGPRRQPGDHPRVAISNPSNLKPGDTVQVNMNAGGGYGDPLERDPEAVLGDVLDGYVSLQGARDDYGVVVHETTLKIDLSTTENLRRSRRGQ